ncbi:TPA: hypothetical protein NGS68_003183 [Vibrio parahaemolyticus]|nr:hypothetical protein [Vibrio parahaemolyticus]HCG6658669.1 hypothetical protein [Vibrio parahaemolyticus]
MKDWIVSVEQKRIKPKKSDSARKNSSIKNAISYLLNEHHKNHYRTKITDLNDAHIVLNNMLNQVDLRKLNRSDLGSGGNVSNIASSFVLSLPADLYHPSVEEWNKIHEVFLENFVYKLNLEQEKKQKKLENTDIDKLSARSRKEYPLDLERSKVRFDVDAIRELSTAVIHDESQKPYIEGKTSGSHLNFVLCNLYNGEVAKIFTQKAGLNAVKKSFNEAVKKELKLDCKKYIPHCDRGDDTPAYNDKNHHLKTLREKKIKTVVDDKPVYYKEKSKPYWAARSEKIAKAEKSLIVANEFIKKGIEAKDTFYANKKQYLREMNKVKSAKTKKAEKLKERNSHVADINTLVARKEKEIKSLTEIEAKKNKIVDFLKDLISNDFLFTIWQKADSKVDNSKYNEVKESALLKSEVLNLEDDIIQSLKEINPDYEKEITQQKEEQHQKQKLQKENSEKLKEKVKQNNEASYIKPEKKKKVKKQKKSRGNVFKRGLDYVMDRVNDVMFEN